MAGLDPDSMGDDNAFARACRLALQERPDLAEMLDTPARLAALAALPAHPSLPPLQEVAGMTRRTWGTSLRHLHHANVALRPDGRRGTWTLNPGLIGLSRLVLEYRRLHERPPPGLLAEPTRAGVRAMHQRGVETAWIVSGSDLGNTGQPIGPSSDLEPFQAMRSSNQYVYFGKRRLTRWDHAFLYLLSQRDEFNDRAPSWGIGPSGTSDDLAGTAIEPPFRAQALFYAMTSPDLFQDPDFRKWATFYHLDGMVQRRTDKAAKGIPPGFQEEVKRMRTDFGVEEGWLAG